MATIVVTSPAAAETYDKEKNITWDDISPSLQARFINLNKRIDDELNSSLKTISQIRVTIGPTAPVGPINPPKQDRDVWFDTGENALKFYMQRGSGDKTTPYKWETTKAAWYGGKSNDVATETPNKLNVNWTLVKTMNWISPLAQYGKYDNPPKNTEPMSDFYVIPKAGTYFVREMSYLFEYNAQTGYTHDGGKITVTISKVTAAGATTSLIGKTYDSKGTYRSYTPTGSTKYPCNKQTYAVKDKITFSVTQDRKPSSTDDVEIYQVASCFIYRLTDGVTTSEDPPAFFGEEIL